MSLSRIPLQQVFRSKPTRSPSSASTDSTSETAFVPRDITPPTSVFGTPEKLSSSPPQLNTFSPPPRLTTFALQSRAMSASPNRGPPVPRGTRTPQMLEYERQAEERAREQEAMQEERDRMTAEMNRIQQEQDRIAQEEYEMRQYYEAEALKHAEEVRLHQEEVRQHQQRLREHERRIRDHEASSEAFAKVIAMPAKPGRGREISFLQPRDRTGTGLNGNGANGP